MKTSDPRDTEMLMDEVFFKNEIVKSRLFGLEKTEDSMYKLIDHSYQRLSDHDAEFRFIRRLTVAVLVTLISSLGGIVTILVKLWAE